LEFDANLREEGFSLEGTTAYRSNEPEIDGKSVWEGVSQEILGRKEWFEAWVEGERKCEYPLRRSAITVEFTFHYLVADDQYNEIISSSDAWKIVDDGETTNMADSEANFQPTNSARRVKALIEQITG
jgi:hypothetical protein